MSGSVIISLFPRWAAMPTLSVVSEHSHPHEEKPCSDEQSAPLCHTPPPLAATDLLSVAVDLLVLDVPLSAVVRCVALQCPLSCSSAPPPSLPNLSCVSLTRGCSQPPRAQNFPLCLWSRKATGATTHSSL